LAETSIMGQGTQCANLEYCFKRGLQIHNDWRRRGKEKRKKGKGMRRMSKKNGRGEERGKGFQEQKRLRGEISR